MSVVVVGLSQRSGGLDVLEPFAVSAERMPKALHDLQQRAHLSEVVLLSTCMRTEVYAVASRWHGAMADIRNFCAEWSGMPPEHFSDRLYSLYDDSAVRHLFKVAAGADSAVLGESEVLGQVRRAWESAAAEGACGPVLGVLFRQAVEVGKRARAETSISRGNTSMAHAGVVLAAERLGSLDGRTVLVVGAGEMGASISRALGAEHHPLEVLVCNRTEDMAVNLASRLPTGRALPWEDLADGLAAADLVLACTASPGVVIEAHQVEAAMASRRGDAPRPMFIVDVGVPRNVDPRACELPGVTLLDLDGVRHFAEAAMHGRRQELPKIEALLDEEVERYATLAAQRELAPVITALHERAEAIRRGELERFSGPLSGLDERQREAVEALTSAVVAKLLHDPTVTVKESAGSDVGEQLVEALRRLFDL
ncbi:MAG: glutamyl-tRNA reductase [Acidimicrobiales bacterium]